MIRVLARRAPPDQRIAVGVVRVAAVGGPESLSPTLMSMLSDAADALAGLETGDYNAAETLIAAARATPSVG